MRTHPVGLQKVGLGDPGGALPRDLLEEYGYIISLTGVKRRLILLERQPTGRNVHAVIGPAGNLWRTVAPAALLRREPADFNDRHGIIEILDHVETVLPLGSRAARGESAAQPGHAARAAAAAGAGCARSTRARGARGCGNLGWGRDAERHAARVHGPGAHAVTTPDGRSPSGRTLLRRRGVSHSL